MNKFLLYIFLLVVFTSAFMYAQASRLNALGGLSIGIEDIDNFLTPFNFGNNPAWLYMHEKESYLNISPSISNSWGNYRRRFDSEGNMNYATTFKGVKTLGEPGTFLGITTYNYEVRRNYFHTLKYDSYAGEAFFFVDTTVGNFHYNGPKVELMYSWELAENLYAGGSASYQLMDGLKKVFTYASTTYRRVGLNAGLAYQATDDIVLGANYTFFDSQEAIECSDVNLLDVEVFLYRGETYFIKERGSSVNHKVRKKGSIFSGQIFSQVNEDFQIALQTNYSPSNTKVLIPESGFKEVEEGYSWFKSLDVQIKSRYKLNSELTTGIYAAYFDNYSWSRHSHKNLLLWEWQIKEMNVGIGASYKFTPDILVGIDYIFSSKNIDSSKYIDGRYADLISNDHSIKFGVEYEMLDETFVRAGYRMNKNQFDVYRGGEDVMYNIISLGIGLPMYSSMIIDVHFEYSHASTKDNYSHSGLGGFVSLRLNSFE